MLPTPFSSNYSMSSGYSVNRSRESRPNVFNLCLAIEQGEVPNCLLHQSLKKLCSRCVKYRQLISANRYRRAIKMRAALQVSLFNTKRVALTKDIAVLQKENAELISQVHTVEALIHKVSSSNAMLLHTY